jgi:hypothetical protein
MESKPLVLLVVGIVAGALVGFGGGFALYNSQIVDLKGSLTDTQLQYVTLSSQYQVLSTQNDKLLANYTALSTQEKSLSDNYNQLQGNYGQLQSNYKDLKTFLGGLSSSILSLNETLYTTGFLPKAFSRTLNNQEVSNVTSLVSSLDQTEPSSLAAYNKIYSYVSGFITSVHETSYPYLQPSYSTINGTKYVSSFTIGYHEVYFRTPSETIKYREGNAVDQAVLQYAMMINYQQNIKKVSQDIYLGLIDFQDGTQGAAVFVPSPNGQLTIFDASGRYMTHDFNQVTAKLAAAEMGAYYNTYADQGKVIVNFTLYKINTVDGSVVSIVKGPLSNIIAFFSS